MAVNPSDVHMNATVDIEVDASAGDDDIYGSPRPPDWQPYLSDVPCLRVPDDERRVRENETDNSVGYFKFIFTRPRGVTLNHRLLFYDATNDGTPHKVTSAEVDKHSLGLIYEVRAETRR